MSKITLSGNELDSKIRSFIDRKEREFRLRQHIEREHTVRAEFFTTKFYSH